MVENCPASCGSCDDDGDDGSDNNDGDCTDLEGECSNWASSGYCKGEYGEWMSKNCAKSCKKCGGKEPDQEIYWSLIG